PAGRTPESVNAALRGMEPLLQILENTLGKQTFLAGPAFSTADICLGANLARWFMFDLQRPGTPNLEAWMGKLRQRPAYQTHIADPSLHLA
ncbi:MAG: glutathione S-transferase C-terminal domain-containing protein, partial [SAR324 cluster bacterium]|nr:glutathione S-transferase C-terminal domain-containing protein [SAR324 cluster bacterium]